MIENLRVDRFWMHCKGSNGPTNNVDGATNLVTGTVSISTPAPSPGTLHIPAVALESAEVQAPLAHMVAKVKLSPAANGDVALRAVEHAAPSAHKQQGSPYVACSM